MAEAVARDHGQCQSCGRLLVVLLDCQENEVRFWMGLWFSGQVGRREYRVAFRGTVDHIVPERICRLLHQAPHQLVNLLTLCRSCHSRKTALQPLLYRGDVHSYVRLLDAADYPMERVREALKAYGLRDYATAEV